MNRDLRSRSVHRSAWRDPGPAVPIQNSALMRPRDSSAELTQVDVAAYQRSYPLLLLVNVTGGVHYREFELFSQAVILLHDHALEDAETLADVGREVQIHAGFKPFEPGPSFQNAIQRHFQGQAEVQGEIR